MKPSLLFCVGVLAAATASAAGTITNLAGNGSAGSKGDGGPALDAAIDNPFGVVRGPDGAVWFADYSAHSVRRIDADGRIATIIGNGLPGSTAATPTDRTSSLRHPHEIRFDRSGNLLVADTENHRIQRYDPRTRRLDTFAGTGQAGYSGDGGPAAEARFNSPISIQFAPSGDLYVADIGNHVVRRIDAASRGVTTFAGTGKAGATPEGSPIAGTPLNGPRSLDFDASGNLWLVTREGNQVLRFDLAAGTIHVAAGTGRKGFTGDGGPAGQATLNGPKGIAVAPNGDVYLADTENHAIRRLDRSTGTLERVAGTGERGDGPVGKPLECRLSRPHGVFVEADGSILVGDSESHRVRVCIPPKSR
jgi:streptogramin lyase